MKLKKHIFKTDIRFRDILNINYQRIRNKKMRTVLTVFGIGIGIAAVLFLVGLTFGLQKIVVDKVANAESLVTLDVLANGDISNIIPINDDAISKIKSMPEVAEVSPVKSLSAQLSGTDIKTQGALFGVKNSYFRLAGKTMTYGTTFSDEPEDAKKIIISSSTAKLLNFNTSKVALNQEIGIDLFVPNTAAETTDVFQLPDKFTVVGVIEDESNYVFVPLKNFDLIDFSQYFELKVKAMNAESVQVLKDKISALGFAVTALIDTLDQMNKIFHISQIVFAVIGLIALFIASIGMFNTMTIALLERTREIGVMKAIGATDRAIKQMFMFEAVAVGFVGGASGVILGYIAMFSVNVVFAQVAQSFGGEAINMFYIPNWFLLTIIVLSVFIGYLTGIYPSHRAAKINPLDALRYE
ncbi:hypothetical protein COT78_02680 [Candidatus Berkelbacteria bacterium CG10_big_fil_rev_8_21_14_0_10_43_13]|uniref:ABC transporter permease n=1 Tax=Candidatus Berkelbacteria bacterium CG10_big_fil_rev_8_21_14_0_10_43_13 TaxID=1974514 RepID=A0A2H0W668_9BACT|nr:MAG: hypothetical protein COT78_02680 [Candidatus Berkelbacteria bacterium CG10_big_fil_rev_8_21_14_0_10_43_13]